VAVGSDDIFKFLENLVTSDASEAVRLSSIFVIMEQHLNEGENLLKWVFQHEESTNVLLEVLKSLQSSRYLKAKELISTFERTIENRFSEMDIHKKEEMSIGHIERLLGRIQAYLTDEIFYDGLDELALDKLYDEIVELGELELITKKKILKIMKFISDCYLAEGASEHNSHERWLSYQKAMISSEFGLAFCPNDRQLLFNYGYASYFLELYHPAIKAFKRLYKIEKKIDKLKYKKLKKIRNEGGIIVEYGRSGPLDYLTQLYAKTGRKKKQKWAIKQNLKRKAKFRKLKTGL
jgi:hypothetical protein